MPESGPELPTVDKSMTPERTFEQRQVDRVVEELKSGGNLPQVPKITSEVQTPQITSQVEFKPGGISPVVEIAKSVVNLKEDDLAKKLGGGPEGGIHAPRQLSPEEMELLRKMEEKRRPFTEILMSSENPRHIRVAERMYWAVMEDNPALFNPLYTNQELAAIVARLRRMDPHYFDIPDDLKKEMGVGIPPGKEELARELDATVREHIARTKLLELWGFKNTYSGDTGNYMQGIFVTPQRPKMEAMMFKWIGEAGPTTENKEAFGILVDKAMRAWVDAAEGKIPGIGNPWGGDIYESERRKLVDYLTRNVTGGDKSAVRLAELLLRTFDVHVSYAVSGARIDPKGRLAQILRAIGRVEGDGFVLDQYKKLADQRDEYERDADTGDYKRDKRGDKILTKIALEASDTTNDTAKAAFIGLRQLLEYATKANPRAVAAPATIGCFPNLTSDLLHILAVKEDKEDGRYISLWEIWRNKGVSFGQLPWDEVDWDYKGGRYKGLPKNVEHVPYGLQKFYAVMIFDAIMRKDFTEAGGPSPKGIQNAEYLHGLNKPYEVAFSILLEDRDLDSETITKLRQLTKVNQLAGFVVANTWDKLVTWDKIIGNVGNIVETMKKPKTHNDSIKGDIGDYAKRVLVAASNSEFFSVRESSEGKKLKSGKDLYSLEKDLFNEIVKKRMIGVKPSLLVGSWFTSQEINAMNKVGVFAPFKA